MTKDEFLQTLQQAGYHAEFRNNGIPTVCITNSSDFGPVNQMINKIRTEKGYDQSFGIYLSYEQLQTA